MNKMQLFFIFWLAGLAACTPIPENVTRVKECAPIYPDYTDITIPYNIAPLNFRINVPADECYAKIEGSESEVFEYHGTNTIRFKMKDWIRLTRANRGKAFFVTIATKKSEAKRS